MQRTKGAMGERTIVNLLKENGFDNAMRNHSQTAIGGFDIVGVEPFAIEVKNHKKLSVSTWWKQATEQATDGLIPVLIYHIHGTSRWLVQVPMSAVNQELCSQRTVTMDFEDFVYIARELMPP